LEALESLEGRRPDGIVAVGGGSVIDTAKAVAIALWHDITSPDRLTELFARPSRLNSAEAEPRPRIIAIPTTLSVAELSPIGGMLIEARSTKEIVGHQYAIPRSIIYDPSALLGTPRATLLSSGIKALDHAVEALCAIEANHFAAPLAERAVQLLGGTLPLIASAYDSGEMPLHSALAEAQLACWMSATGPAHGVSVGASHAIGHALGAVCGVPHGLTSCVTLAPVLRWNQNYSAGPQLRIAEALTGRSDQQAGTAVEDLVRRLGLPTRLQEIGVTPNQLTEVAAASFADRCTATNCRPISSVEDISEILLTVI
jgi:maleylacetate reductase